MGGAGVREKREVRQEAKSANREGTDIAKSRRLSERI
jgi:hypothetical protein